MKPYTESLLLIGAIIAGSVVGLFTSFETLWTDYFIIAMLFFLFYSTPMKGIFKGIKNRRYILVALATNFIAIPVVAFALSTVFVDASSAIFVGLIIYLVAPCTDWFLGFTKLAKGDVEVNSVLLPFNLIMQILLLPVYMYLFTTNTVGIPFEAFFDVLIYWVLLPFAVAQLVRAAIATFKRELLEKSNELSETLVLITVILLVFSIFNTNIESLIENTAVLPKVLLVIIVFFVATFFLALLISRAMRFSKKERISLTMTTAARNAPLMLAISILFFPQEALIHLVLVIGMLVEFPHLITITYLLKSKSTQL